MTKADFFQHIQKHGFSDQGFITDLKQDTTGAIQKIIRLFESGKDVEAWAVLQQYYDEYCYFSFFCVDDEILVYAINEVG